MSALPHDENRAKPTRVAFGITELNVGGAEKSLVELVTRLDPWKWMPSVVTLLPAEGPLVDRLRAAGIEVETLGMRSAWGALAGLHRWRKILARERPAVLVTFLFHANLLGRLAARGAKVPRHVSGVRVAERGANWHVALDRWTKGWTDHYACVSESVAAFTREELLLPAEKVSVLRNGVSVDRPVTAIDDAAFGLKATDRVLLMVGRLDRQKGPEVALEAFARVKEDERLADVRLVFVGEGPMRGKLEERTRRLNLASSVRLAGYQENVAGWLARSEGLVLGSRWEGLPNVVLEAMGAARAVVATRVDGTKDVVLDGETGWLTEVDDVAGMSRAMRALLTEPEEAKRRGEAGRQRVINEYSFERMVGAWDELLTRMMTSAR